MLKRKQEFVDYQKFLRIRQDEAKHKTDYVEQHNIIKRAQLKHKIQYLSEQQEKEGIKDVAQPGEEDMVTIEKTNVANWPFLDIEYYMNFERTEGIQLNHDSS